MKFLILTALVFSIFAISALTTFSLLPSAQAYSADGNLNSEASCTSLVAGTWSDGNKCTITNPITSFEVYIAPVI